ncbi:MAG: putative DNA-binding domain-containing protein [Nitrospirota bacterium]|nr:MAG: putative DNA-binding domain-containing protein [Nitrospirota bacterium]
MAKLTLSQFQHLFAQASHRFEEAPIAPVLLDGIIPGGSLSTDAALEVYRTGHIVRMTEALGETFEAVWWVAGDENYFRLAKEFLLTQSSTSYNLSDFGQSFPDFLAERQPFSDLPFIADLARFEWAFKEVFHLPPHTSLTADEFQKYSLSGNLRLAFGPSVRLFRSPYSVYEIWKLRGTRQESLPEALWNQPQYLLCYKHNQQVYIKHLNPPEFQILEFLLSGSGIDNALSQTLQVHPDLGEATVTNLFSMLIQTGFLTGLMNQS